MRAFVQNNVFRLGIIFTLITTARLASAMNYHSAATATRPIHGGYPGNLKEALIPLSGFEKLKQASLHRWTPSTFSSLESQETKSLKPSTQRVKNGVPVLEDWLERHHDNYFCHATHAENIPWILREGVLRPPEHRLRTDQFANFEGARDGIGLTTQQIKIVEGIFTNHPQVCNGIAFIRISINSDNEYEFEFVPASQKEPSKILYKCNKNKFWDMDKPNFWNNIELEKNFDNYALHNLWKLALSVTSRGKFINGVYEHERPDLPLVSIPIIDCKMDRKSAAFQKSLPGDVDAWTRAHFLMDEDFQKSRQEIYTALSSQGIPMTPAALYWDEKNERAIDRDLGKIQSQFTSALAQLKSDCEKKLGCSYPWHDAFKRIGIENSLKIIRQSIFIRKIPQNKLQDNISFSQNSITRNYGSTRILIGGASRLVKLGLFEKCGYEYQSRNQLSGEFYGVDLAHPDVLIVGPREVLNPFQDDPRFKVIFSETIPLSLWEKHFPPGFY